MSDSQTRIKGRSVAAFLLLPQFSLCFQHFSFIVPVFMRTVAVMFEQAGLIPKNHPATKYGMEGVRKYKLFELMGEAWYNLRSTNANPYQWSLFSAVVLMVVFTVLSAITFLLNAAGVAMGTAHAQIFDHPGGNTDMTTVPATGSASLFDTTIPALGGSPGSPQADYGIMILDKILRQGAMIQGGALQKGLGGLMQLYNTGMLVIAGVMVLWAIVAVVTDTAKTGQLGGGRHNMVWAPIRIVFGLGLLIPLGASGFNSGQFMVMKIAEWGSNFGTRGWAQYVASTTSASLVVKAEPTETSTILGPYLKMWVCRAAYNGYTSQAASAPSSAQIIRHIENVGIPDTGKRTFTYTNDAAANLCGTVTYLTDNDPAIISGLASSDLTVRAATRYKQSMRQAYSSLVHQTGMDSGVITPDSKTLACKFVANYIPGDKLGIDCGTMSATPPGQPAGAEAQAIAQKMRDTIKAANDTAFTALQNFTASEEFRADLAGRGWPSMGIWFHRIQQMNSAVISMQEMPLTTSAGELMTTGSFISSQKAKTRDVILRFDEWWAKVPALTPPAGAGGAPGGTPVLEAPRADLGDIVWAAVKAASPIGFVGTVFGILPRPTVAIAQIAKPSDTVYPMAYLINVGNIMLLTAVGLYGVLTLVPALLGLLPTLSIGAALASSALFAMLTALASSMFVAAVLLAFWIPILPFIRVCFAVLTWMIAVFEAVVMVPVAALTHISTEGEGMGGQVRGVWILWLNVLLRPILTVVGYVAAILIFNTFVIFFTDAIMPAVAAMDQSFMKAWIGSVVYSVVYVGVIYMVATSAFKLMDVIPHAVAKYMGGHADTSFDQDASSFVSHAGQAAHGVVSGPSKVAERAMNNRQDQAQNKALIEKGGDGKDGKGGG